MMFKKILAGILAAACTVTFSTATFAAENPDCRIISYDGNSHATVQIHPRFQYIISISARLVESKGKATLTGSVLVRQTDYKTSIKMTLERSTDQKNWKSVKTFSGVTNVTDTDFAAMEVDYYLTKGYSYRAITTATITGDTGTESTTVTSSIVNY